MIPKTIRWRLPLSYALIALLAALALGAVLLTVLHSYYAQRELEYLNGNAQAISEMMGSSPAADLPLAAQEAQVKSLAFLTHARVQLLGTNGQLLVDSGPVRDLNQISIFSAPDAVEAAQTISQTLTVAPDGLFYKSFIRIERPDQNQTPADATVAIGKMAGATGEPVTMFMKAPANAKLFGFGLGAEPAANGQLSDQVTSKPIYDAAHELKGYVKLSEGPAYGGEIVGSVARGWAVASVVAILIAAGLGLVISRRISAPLLALTDVTVSMAGGNLSARADVTRRDELGTLAHSFNEMADRVEETVVALRRFVADAAHELRTPLTAIHTNLELIASEKDHAKQVGFAKEAQDQVERLATLTRDLLALSRLEANGLGEGQEQVDLVSLVRNTAEPYASRAEQAGLSFSLDLPEETLHARGQEADLRRSVENLLDNAVKFTPEGGSVTVGLCRDGSSAILWVEDTGIGVPPEDLVQVFSRFHRGRNAAAYPGSGLGLAIVRAIVEGHGGTAAVESTPQGTRFVLRLPSFR